MTTLEQVADELATALSLQTDWHPLILAALTTAVEGERAKHIPGQSWHDFYQSKKGEWRARHPDQEYGDVHARWWIGDDIPLVGETREIVDAIVAALLQEGVAAWDGDAIGIISHIVRAQSDRRKAAEATVERLTKALTVARTVLVAQHLAVDYIDAALQAKEKQA